MEDATRVHASDRIMPNAKEYGASGTLMVAGIISGEEYSPDLRGRKAVKVYDKMRRSDATVRAGLMALFLPLLQADYFFEPASDDELDKEVAEFCKYVFFEALNWPSLLSEVLTYMPLGYSVFEMVQAAELRQWKGKDRWLFDKIAFRRQSSVYSWWSEQYGPGITQQLGSGELREIPMDALLIFTNQKEGDNYEGISVLRSAYKHWFAKDALYQIDLVAAERHSLGVIEIEVPEQYDKQEVLVLEASAKKLRANQQSYYTRKRGYTFGWMDMKASTLRDLKPSIEHHDRQISKNVLVQFIELGATSSGSRAVSEDHSKLFMLSEQSAAQYLTSVFAKAVKTVVDWNYTVSAYPQMKVSDISDEDVSMLADAYQKITNAGGITPRPRDENRNRKLLGLPQLTEDEIVELEKQEEDNRNQVKDNLAPNVKPTEVPKEASVKAKIDRARQLYDELTAAVLDEPRAA